jgi:hypothetical protein
MLGMKFMRIIQIRQLEKMAYFSSLMKTAINIDIERKVSIQRKETSITIGSLLINNNRFLPIISPIIKNKIDKWNIIAMMVNPMIKTEMHSNLPLIISSR